MKTLLIGFGLILIGCETRDIQSSEDTSPPIAPTVFEYDAADSSEALDMALWFTGDLTPDSSVAWTFMKKFKRMRRTYGDSLPSVRNRLLLPWVYNSVTLRFDSITAVSMRRGTYTGWDLLPPELRPASWSTADSMSGFCWAEFHRKLHPVRLAEIYATLPGVTYAGASYWMFVTTVTYPMIIYPGRDRLEYAIGHNLDRPFYYFATDADSLKCFGQFDFDNMYSSTISFMRFDGANHHWYGFLSKY